MRTNLICAALAAIALALIIGCGNLLAADLASAATSGKIRACAEDDPCWSWSTMGNMQRGVTLRKGSPRVGRPNPSYPGTRIVDPCDFAYADFRGLIDWKRTERLRGDWLARKHGCNPTLFPPDAVPSTESAAGPNGPTDRNV